MAKVDSREVVKKVFLRATGVLKKSLREKEKDWWNKSHHNGGSPGIIDWNLLEWIRGPRGSDGAT